MAESMISIRRADDYDLQMAIHSLHGIFWALEMLSTERCARGIASEEAISTGIGELICAGEMITKDLQERL